MDYLSIVPHTPTLQMGMHHLFLAKYFCKLFCLFRSVMSKIRHFNSNAVNNISNNSNEAKLHVAKLHMMPSITLTNPDMKSTTITENKNTSGDSSTNLKDYYGDDEKGLP